MPLFAYLKPGKPKMFFPLCLITGLYLFFVLMPIIAGADNLIAAGDNNFVQLGDGTTTPRGTPVQVATGVTQIAAGDHHSLFLKEPDRDSDGLSDLIEETGCTDPDGADTDDEWEEHGNWDIGAASGNGAKVTNPSGCPPATYSGPGNSHRLEQITCRDQLTIDVGTVVIGP